MAYRVLLPQDIAEEGKAWLRERGYELRPGSGVSARELQREIADCDAVLVRTALLSAEVLRAGPRLRVVARHGVGVDNIDLQAAADLGIVVTNGPHSNASSVAEHTLAVMLALARNLLIVDRALREGRFEVRDEVRGVDMEGKVLGVIGLGRIGSRVARMARLGLDMEVIGHDPFLPAERLPEGVSPVGLEELFRRADFVSLHLPATPQTHGLVGGRELAWMKPTAFLVNVARGGVVKEADLLEALRAGRIAGAALDVFAEEPPPRDHPLLALPNVLVTPHTAALTRECAVRMALHAAQGIDEVLSGRPVTWPVPLPPRRA